MKCKKIITWLVVVISVITLFITSILLFNIYKDKAENKEEIDDLIETAIIDSTIEENKNIEIDWNYLKSVNEDIIGWIEIENTSINYPILKDNGNQYYLKHNFNKKYNSNGSIFTLDKSPLEDEETLIYGHNMRNNEMFSSLGKYLNKNYLLEHKKVKIYTEKVNCEGEIFSAYSIGFAIENANIKKLNYEERVEYYKNASSVKIDDIQDTGKILKLSTCSYINSKTHPTDQRYYIIAMLNKCE